MKADRAVIVTSADEDSTTRNFSNVIQFVYYSLTTRLQHELQVLSVSLRTTAVLSTLLQRLFSRIARSRTTESYLEQHPSKRNNATGKLHTATNNFVTAEDRIVTRFAHKDLHTTQGKIDKYTTSEEMYEQHSGTLIRRAVAPSPPECGGASEMQCCCRAML